MTDRSEVQIAVNDLYPTIQGEGAECGSPLMLLRLHGCPVGCPWCDTKETWAMRPEHEVSTLAAAQATPEAWVSMTPVEIASAIMDARPRGVMHVLLTGGEPALQPIGPLVEVLRLATMRVSIETSGVASGFMQHVSAAGEKCQPNWVTVSPKFDMPGGRTVLPEMLVEADEIKHVVGKQADIDRLLVAFEEAELDPRGQFMRVSLQPVSQSAKATSLCVAAAFDYGWNVSIQTHKYMGVR